MARLQRGNEYGTIFVVEYVDTDGQSPFATWFDRLDARGAAKVTVALARLANGNLSNVKGVGGGVFECRIDFGPGYRVYFGRDGEQLVLLLGGGTKRRQQSDIDAAKGRWQMCRRRKQGG